MIPKFKQAFGYDVSTGARYALNDYYFADQPTTEWIATRWGTGKTRETDVLGPGPFGVDTKMFEVEIKDGRWVNAGMLAAYYDRNPEALFPGVAEALIAAVLGIAAPPPLPSVLKPTPPPVKPIPENAKVGPRTQWGTYDGAGDPNPAGWVIDNPDKPGDEKLIKRIEPIGIFGLSHFWEDAPAGSVLSK